MADFLICDTGVYLGGLDVCVTEHLAHRLDGYALAECHRRGKSMPRQMEREILLDATDVSNFFEICVGLLIAEYREQYSVDKFTLIFFEYFLCCGKEWNIHIGFSLLSVCDYPQSSVKHLLDIVGAKLGNIGIGKSCITAILS